MKPLVADKFSFADWRRLFVSTNGFFHFVGPDSGVMAPQTTGSTLSATEMQMPVTVTKTTKQLAQKATFGLMAEFDKPQHALPPPPFVGAEQVLDVVAITSLTKRKKTGHTRPRQPLISLDQEGRLRVANLLAILNVSHSTFSAGVKSGRYPPPDGYDRKMPWWSTTTVRPLVK
jgi:hypothetical protein